MEYLVFLGRIIDEGIVSASESYKDSPKKRDGAVAGFEACRGLSVDGLRLLYIDANKKAHECLDEDRENYWFWRCYGLEVEWVCNVVSAAYYSAGLPPVLSHQPSARGMIAAARILGVSEMAWGN